jgi:hypothetical protein
MNIEKEAHHLIGLADPVGKSMGFLIPVFARRGSNALRVERIGPGERVEAFVDLEPQETPIIPVSKRDSYIGAAYHWAFGFGLNDIIVGQGEEGQDVLRARLVDPFFLDRPLMALEVAEFLHLRDERLRTASLVLQRLRKIGSKAADRWCDLSLLTPDIRNALSRLIAAESANKPDLSIQRITARAHGDVVQIRGLDQSRHSKMIDQITDTIRSTLSELHTLYPPPPSGWKIQLIGTPFSTSESAPRGYDLSALSALVYIADGDIDDLRRIFSRHVKDDIGLYPPRQLREFLRQSLQFRGPSFVLFRMDPELGAILPEVRARKLLPVGLATRTTTAPRPLPSELAALERYPHPTVVVNARDTAVLVQGAGLVGEVRDAVHILVAAWDNLRRRFPARTGYFLRARGIGPDRASDAWAQLYSRCWQLGLTQPTGLRMELEHKYSGATARPRSLGDVLFPGLRPVKAVLDRETSGRSAIDAAVLVEVGESFAERSDVQDWQLYSGSVKQVLVDQGWSISGSLDPMDAAIIMGRRRFEISTSLEDLRRRAPYPLGALLEQDLNEIKRITATENASLGAILTCLIERRELLATVRDLSAFPSESGTIWTLLASQMRRFISSLPTRTRSYYFAILCQAAVQRDRIEQDHAKRLVQAWHHPRFGEAIHLLCTKVRYEPKQAVATLRLAPPLERRGPTRLPAGFRRDIESLKFELVITRDGSAIRLSE